MKPEKLIICGWGPYKEEAVIDFTNFKSSRLFLITGQTGAGKTTIFDAIAYALFGVLSGGMREKGSVRSDFADAATKTYVELFMRHKGEAYHILRNPEYMRPKKKKSGENAYTKEKENAVLTLPDGMIIAGNQDVTRKIEELLGLNEKQFRQISMIAQGEFAKLLFANSSEKITIFRELFGTGIYAAIQSSLKERSAKLYAEYKVFKNKMEEDVHLLSLDSFEWNQLISHEQMDFAAIEEYLASELEEERKTVQDKIAEEKKLENAILALKEELAAVRQINGRFAELENTQEKLVRLEDRAGDIEELNKNIRLAKKAQILTVEEKLLQQKQEEMLQSTQKISRLQKELEACRIILQKSEWIDQAKDKIKEAYNLMEGIEEVEALLLDKTKKRNSVAQQLLSARKQYLESQELFDCKRNFYEEADRIYKKAVIGVAARLLEEGKPCPVCGSIEHPHVAQILDTVPDEKQLEDMKKQMENAQTECSRCFEIALQLQNEEKQIQEVCTELAQQAKDIKGALEKTDAEVLSYVNQNKKEQFEKEIVSYQENQVILTEKEKQLHEAKQELELRKKEAAESEKLFNQKFLESGFASKEAYQSAVASVCKLNDMENEYREYQEARAATKSLCEHLQQSLEGLQIKDVTPFEEEFMDKQARKQTYREEIETCNIKINQINRSLIGIRKNRKKAEEIQSQYGIVKDLDDLANGNNGKRLVFEQFVLAGYFEKILHAANIRLKSMTDGRYELTRAEQISDGRKKDNLEILVMDYYTGRKRSVKTLSGGETFKASLCLALGLSDCVQAENGGLEVETLFIDEGFGALDEESLEQACTTLLSLAGNNRMIGIISHIQELRERIEDQIVIEKHNNGSYVKLKYSGN